MYYQEPAKFITINVKRMSIPVTARTKAWVCRRSIAEIAG